MRQWEQGADVGGGPPPGLPSLLPRAMTEATQQDCKRLAGSAVSVTRAERTHSRGATALLHGPRFGSPFPLLKAVFLAPRSTK